MPAGLAMVAVVLRTSALIPATPDLLVLRPSAFPMRKTRRTVKGLKIVASGQGPTWTAAAVVAAAPELLPIIPGLLPIIVAHVTVVQGLDVPGRQSRQSSASLPPHERDDEEHRGDDAETTNDHVVSFTFTDIPPGGLIGRTEAPSPTPAPAAMFTCRVWTIRTHRTARARCQRLPTCQLARCAATGPVAT